MVNAIAQAIARFAVPMQAERIEDGSADGRGSWRLLRTLIYFSLVAPGAMFVAPRGFVTDLASVPRLPVAWLLAGGLGAQAAVIHDWLYTSHEVSRAVADAVLREALIVCHVSPWRAWLMWAGVRAGGGGAWRAAGQPQPFGTFKRGAIARTTQLLARPEAWPTKS